jgi:hypothetical protein
VSGELTAATAVIYIEPTDSEARRLAWSRTLLHCDQKCYLIAGIGEGKTARLSVLAMLARGEVDIVVTTHGSSLASEPGVEVAGAGRTAVRTLARAHRLRQIAALVDSGLSDEAILRRLRAGQLS